MKSKLELRGQIDIVNMRLRNRVKEAKADGKSWGEIRQAVVDELDNIRMDIQNKKNDMRTDSFS